MTQTTTIIIAVIAIVLAGGGVLYALNTQNERGPRGSEAAEETRIVDNLGIPENVLNNIERDYPDYIIDDADRETQAGQVYYEIDLEHRDPTNDSEYELTYDENWELINIDFDQD